jgi:Mlc titration factor MtfA (ptsG expression regulator)
MPSEAFYNTWDGFLQKYHLYYRDLSETGKKRFVKRLHSILNNVEIIGKSGLEVTEEIKVLVVANLVQLTFGLKEYWLYGYDYIHLHPEAFFIQKTGETVTGSTYNSKIIALSWHDFAFDHLHPQKGRSVSLAQYALALLRTVYNGSHYDLHFGSYLDTWFDVIKRECALKSEDSEYERFNEKAEDLNYVFSQCVELFFDVPDLLASDLPATYAHLCLLLNQNPVNTNNDYAYERGDFNKVKLIEPLPKRIVINHKYKNWHWLYNVTFFSVACSPVCLFFLLENILIDPIQLLIFIILSGIFLSIIFFSYLKEHGIFNKFWALLLNALFGYAPGLITLLILINNLSYIPNSSVVSKHEIITYYLQESIIHREQSNPITFVLRDQFLDQYPKARTFEKFDKMPVTQPNYFNGIEYDIRRGLLGLPIIYKRELY